MIQGSKKRMYRSKKFWLSEIEKFRLSDQSMSDYCRENNLATSTFTRKLQILGDKTIPAKPAKSKSSFIEVKSTALSMLIVRNFHPLLLASLLALPKIIIRYHLPSSLSSDFQEAQRIISRSF